MGAKHGAYTVAAMLFLDRISPPWHITVYYLLTFTVMVFLTKLLSAVRSPRSVRARIGFLLFAPALSMDTWERSTRANRRAAGQILWKAGMYLFLVVAIYCWLPDGLSHPQLSWAARGYLAAIPFWILTEAIGALTQLLYLAAGFLIPALHDQPWRASGLADFWGRRWNRIFSDWFRENCFRPLRRNPATAMWLTFLVSALLHEWVISVSLWMACGTNRFGWMLAYFLLQAAGMEIERRWMRRNRWANRVLLWMMILAPVPLVLNEGTLRAFHFVR